jgi:uncharacterized membrane protein
MYRDLGYYWLRLAIYAALGLCIGTVFFNLGTGSNDIRDRASAMAFVSGFLTFMAIGGFPSFVEDIKVISIGITCTNCSPIIIMIAGLLILESLAQIVHR